MPPLVREAIRAGRSAKFVFADRSMAHLIDPFVEMRWNAGRRSSLRIQVTADKCLT